MNEKTKATVEELMGRAQWAAFTSKADDKKTKNTWRLKMALYVGICEAIKDGKATPKNLGPMLDHAFAAYGCCLIGDTMVKILGENGERLEDLNALRDACIGMVVASGNSEQKHVEEFFDKMRKILE